MTGRSKVALLTGATGFIGKSVLKRLLDDSEEWTVIVLVRPKILTRTASGKKKRRRKNARPASSEDRMKALVASLGIPKEHARRLHYIESHIDGSLDPQVLYEAVKREMVQHGATAPLRLDLVIHMAASLQQDCDGMATERVERIRKRNYDVNVHGLNNLLTCVERFGTPENVRVLRPSIVCGRDSRTGLMASLDYFDSWWLRSLWSMFAALQKKVPLPGNAGAILDIIDIQDVVRAVMDFVHLDCTHRSDSGLGSVYYMSTAYVHGKRKGILMEEPVYPKPDQQYHNSYEETKAMAEHVVDCWGASFKGGNSMCTYHHLTNENAPTLEEVVVMIHEHYKVPRRTYSKKLEFYSDIDDFAAALRGLRPQMAGRYIGKFFKYIKVLTPYMMRDSSTKFDCSSTTSMLGHIVATNEASTKYFTSIV